MKCEKNQFNIYPSIKYDLFKKLLKPNNIRILFAEVIQRFYSDRYYLIMKKQFDPIPCFSYPNNKFNLRSLKQEDLPIFFNFKQKELSEFGLLERLRIIPFLSSGFDCWVVETEAGRPCHICWVITQEHNRIAEKFFKGRLLPLAQDEYLVEGAFTLEEYRRQGILTWRRLALYEEYIKRGKKKIISFIKCDNLPSLLSNKSVGFELFLIRKDQWRFFHNSFRFQKIKEKKDYPLKRQELIKLFK